MQEEREGKMKDRNFRSNDDHKGRFKNNNFKDLLLKDKDNDVKNGKF